MTKTLKDKSKLNLGQIEAYAVYSEYNLSSHFQQGVRLEHTHTITEKPL